MASHRLDLDTSLDKENTIIIFESVKIIIKGFVSFLEGKLIRDETAFPEYAPDKKS